MRFYDLPNTAIRALYKQLSIYMEMYPYTHAEQVVKWCSEWLQKHLDYKLYHNVFLIPDHVRVQIGIRATSYGEDYLDFYLWYQPMRFDHTTGTVST